MEDKTVKRFTQVSEIQLSYRTHVRPSQRPIIRMSNDAYQILKDHWDESRLEFIEQFKVLLTNRANKVLGIVEISTGGISGTVADPKVIFAAALKAGACGIILAHNHPSGNLTPSQQDIELTRRMRDGGKLLEIQLLDHIILTTESYYSMADEGLI